MFGDIDGFTIVVIAGCALMLTAQLLLCFKVKSILLRLAPTVALSLISVALIIIARSFSEGWEALGYVILFVLGAALVAASLLGWLIYGISCVAKRLSRG